MFEYIAVSQYAHLLHPCSTSLVTCCDSQGRPNIITIAWLMPVSINPPLVAISMRCSRFSYQLIKANGEFVVNVAPFNIAQQALYCGRRSGSRLDKFSATGLTAQSAQKVRPPIIQQCLAFLECRLQQDIEAGDHNLLIAEVIAAYTHPGVLGHDGLYDLKQAHPLLHLGRDRFTTAQIQTIEPSLE